MPGKAGSILPTFGTARKALISTGTPTDGDETMKNARNAWPTWLFLLLLLPACSLEREMTEKDFVRMSLDLYFEGRQAEEADDLATAREFYTRSLRLAPRPIVYYQLGMVEFKERNYEAAVEQMQKALSLSPNFVQASEMIKRIEAGRQISSQAEGMPRLAEGAIISAPPPPPAAYTRLRAATPEGEVEEGQAAVPVLATGDPPPAAPETLAEAPSPARENLLEGLRLLEDRKYAEAEAWFSALMPRDPGNPDLHFYLGNAQFQQGNYEAAYRQYLRALQIDPEMARAYVNLGFCQEILGSSLEAEKSYLRAIELVEHPDALYNLGLLYQKRGLFADSIKYLESYLAQVSTGPSADEARRQVRLMRREQ